MRGILQVKVSLVIRILCHQLCVHVGLGMASTEAVVLLPKTEYFIGNTQSPDDASLIVVASRAVSDRHARMVTGDCSSSFSPNLCKYIVLVFVKAHMLGQSEV